MLKIKFIRASQSLALWLLVLFAVNACSTFRSEPQDGPPAVVHQADKDLPRDVVPRHEPRSKYGNPKSYVVFGKRYYTLPSSQGFVQRGIASWYGKKFHGRRTSSGETYDMYAMTAAHTQLPLPTYVQVTNLKNGRQVVLRVNDRGPFHGNRIIDLSYSAARKLDIIREGTGLVEVRALDPHNYRANNSLNRKDYSVKEKNTKQQETIEQQAVYSSEDNVEDTVDDTATVSSSDPKLFIQVGAFGERKNADQLMNQLSPLNLGKVFVSSVIQNSQQLHRVRIGPISNVELVDKTVAQLTSMGMKDHQVVIE